MPVPPGSTSTVAVGPDGAVVATVTDDGVGPGTGERAGGQGLDEHRQAGRALGGTVDDRAGGARRRGTSVAWSVPAVVGPNGPRATPVRL